MTKKFIILTFFIIILIDVITTGFMLIDQNKMMSDELKGRGHVLAGHLANEIIPSVMKKDSANIKRLVEDFKSGEIDIRYIYVVDSDNNTIALISDENIDKYTPDVSTNDIIDFEAPILEGRQGFVHIGMDRTLINQKLARTAQIATVNLVVEGILGIMMAYIAGNYLTRPIKDLVRGAQEIGHCNLDYKIDPGAADDEILVLSKAINQMSCDLNKTISDLRVSEEKYRNLVELSIDIIYLSDSNGNQLFMNGAGYKLLETGPDEVIGQKWTKWIHPDDREKTFRKFREMIEQGSDVFGYENRYVSKSGNIINVLHNVRIIRNNEGEVVGTQGIARDITRRKQAMETLMKLRTAVEEAPDGIQIIDLDGTVAYSNKAVEKIYGFSPEELKGKHVNEMNEDPEFAGKVIIPSIMKTGQWKGELMVKHKNGNTFPIWLNTSIVKNESGDPIAMIGTIRDLTKQKEMEQLEKQLLQADKLATIGQLAAGVAHEINNPLGNISLYSQMLLKKTSDEAVRNKLIVIDDEANRAAQIVKGLLDFARQSEPKLSPIDINKEILKVLNILKPQLRDIKVTTRFPPLPFIRGDSSQIGQVIMNMTTNSIQAIKENGEITVETLEKDGNIEINIIDNGAGIAKENLNKIFDPFFTTKKHGEGTGLGLAISYGIIKRHKGSIAVKSEVGKGTTFTIKLPV